MNSPAKSTSSRFAAACCLLLLGAAASSPLLRAIPNSVGGGGVPFINPAGMRLEDFANREEMWKPDFQLKGRLGNVER